MSNESKDPKQGEWIPDVYGYLVCSVCGKYWINIGDEHDFNYCPRCGAKMNKENKDGKS